MRRTSCLAAVIAASLVGLVACMSDNQALAPQPAGNGSLLSPVLGNGQGGGGLPLQSGDSVSYFVCHGNGGPDSGSAVIGLLGGKVTFGPHELDVPPAALLKPTTITARTLPGDTIAVRFEPQGLTFLLPATLQLSYAQCQPQPTGTLSVVYTNDLLDELLELIESIDERGQHKVVGLINHFSVYAIAE
jgi:hypothetical protein